MHLLPEPCQAEGSRSCYLAGPTVGRQRVTRPEAEDWYTALYDALAEEETSVTDPHGSGLAGSRQQPGCRTGQTLRAGIGELILLCIARPESEEAQMAERLAASGLGMEPAELSSALRQLERRGLLHETSSSFQDRAGRCYRITASGVAARKEMLEIWMSALQTVGAVTEELIVADPRGDIPPEAARAHLMAERQEVERLRSDLLSTVSHELRTPLTLIRTCVGLLLDSDPDLAMRERLLRNIKQSADRMHLLVTDILDLVRLRGGRVELQWRYLSLNELIGGAAALMRPLLDEKEQKLELELVSPAPRVMGDYRRLEQVLLNLLSNANKYSPERARIRVTVTELVDSVTIGVADTGPGIAREVQAHLFEQFYTSRTSSPSHNIGAGLGLPIAKGIVEAHGGRIWVESEVERGATFYFSLPKESMDQGE